MIYVVIHTHTHHRRITLDTSHVDAPGIIQLPGPQQLHVHQSITTQKCPRKSMCHTVLGGRIQRWSWFMAFFLMIFWYMFMDVRSWFVYGILDICSLLMGIYFWYNTVDWSFNGDSIRSSLMKKMIFMFLVFTHKTGNVTTWIVRLATRLPQGWTNSLFVGEKLEN